jgi:hypothetical protein
LRTRELSLLIVTFPHDRADGCVDAVPRHGLATNGRDGGSDDRARAPDPPRRRLGIVAMDALPWLAHSVMMPAMLVPTLLRFTSTPGARLEPMHEHD